MVRRWIFYALSLGAAVLFHISLSDYLSWFLLVLAACFPLFSLALSLPLLLGCRFLVTPAQQALQRGERAAWSVEITSRTGLPLPQVSFRLTIDNRLTGYVQQQRRSLALPAKGRTVEVACSAAHCGAYACTLSAVWACDLLGLFALPLRPPAPAVVLSLPIPAPEVPPPGFVQEPGGRLRPRPGGGPGEDYDLRPYRPGDPFRSIHWKLSSKLDNLVVRETMEPYQDSLALTFDLFGPPEILDQVLDRLSGLCQALLSHGLPHHVLWVGPISGSLQVRPVSSPGDWGACLEDILSQPAPLAGKSILDAPLPCLGGPGPVRHYHVSPQKEAP